MKKFFVDKENIKNETVVIEGEEFLHLSKVLRSNIGEEIKIICGDEFEYICIIEQIEKRFAIAKIKQKNICEANPKCVIDVFQGLPKGEKLELIIQKITELGANAIIPFESDFTIAKNNNIKMERMERISKEACKQCGRSFPVEIKQTIKLKNIEQNLENYDLVLFLYENADLSSKIENISEKIKSANKIAIIVGSEGGFSEQENKLLTNLNTEKISLGKRILRTETASITLVGFVSLLKGN